MKKLGLSKFEVELGEEIELTISSLNESLQLPIVLLDGDLVEPNVIVANTTKYRFQFAKTVDESHQCVVRLPDLGLENTGYKIELFGAGRSVANQTITPGERQGLGNLIYTFSTHGAGGGSNK